jgi:hypothetical protein
MIEATENGYDVTTEKEVYTLVCDNQFWYVKHKHRGTAQIGVRDNCICLTFDSEVEREQYIEDNGLNEIITQPEQIEEM